MMVSSRHSDNEAEIQAFARSVRENQANLAEHLAPAYDFIVCGSGTSGSVVARRLAENPAVSVLLLEAGGSDACPEVADAGKWIQNFGGERDWSFMAEPNAMLNGRTLPIRSGKVLGGGSSINAMVWSRGHRSDWDHFASEADDSSWNYASVLDIYRLVEDWQGAPDAARRGIGGMIFVQPFPDPHPIVAALMEAAQSAGIPSYPDQNGSMMEAECGCALMNVAIREGRRQSVFRSYAYPLMDRPNFTVLSGALAARVLVEGTRAAGVEFLHNGHTYRLDARQQVVLSLGAINTPKLLMQSGIGDETELRRHGIATIQHLPGVGRNLHDHFTVAGCVWESVEPLDFRGNGGGCTLFAKSAAELDGPDMQLMQATIPYVSEETAKLGPPANSWSILPGIVRPASRGRLRLKGPDPADPVEIDLGLLSDCADMKAARACLELSRDLGNSAVMRPFVKREVMPAGRADAELDDFIRNAILPQWHHCGTARMGRDPLATVDGRLKVHGMTGLTIADASIMPRGTTGNTMAPCVVIGERAGTILKAEHGL